MAIINLLDKNVYNRISAGEVVERPASMVKELVENSLDAGADKIEISVVGGGIRSVTVADNGCGIEKSQLERAFLPHATSKIKSASDLDAIFTLGFRGEALASIGAVTRAEIISKTASEQLGASIVCNGGEIGEVVDKPCETGTTVICKDLFFNTPARAKFLKTPRAEEGEITSIVTKLAFSNPDAAFKLEIEGKTVLETFGGGLKECLASVYGTKTLEQCFFIESEKNGVKISGYIGKLSFTKPTRSYQTLIVNGRYVTDNTVSAAVQNAYSSYLMKRQYPFFVLGLTVPPEIVDVNVHPRKSEVRFSNNQIIYSAVYSAVSKVIDGVSEAVNIIKEEQTSVSSSRQSTEKLSDNSDVLSGELQEKSAYKPVNGTFANNSFFESGFSTPKNDENSSDYGKTFEGGFLNEKSNSARGEYITAVRDSGAEYPAGGGYAGSFEPESGVDIFAENKKYIERLERESVEKNSEFSEQNALDEQKSGGQTKMQIAENDMFVGQAFDTYLIFTRGEDMYFIDQHAAHERLLFDELSAKVNAKSVEKQALLIPYSFYVSAEDFDNIYDRMDYFREMGIDIDLIGDNGFCVSSLPCELCEINLRKFFDDILFDNSFKREKMPAALKEKLMQTACKHAVKGGDKLDRSEIDELLKKVSNNLGLKCPHGRPIAVKITKTELEKWFKRIV